jgi:hypothetical protein
MIHSDCPRLNGTSDEWAEHLVPFICIAQQMMIHYTTLIFTGTPDFWHYMSMTGQYFLEAASSFLLQLLVN